LNRAKFTATGLLAINPAALGIDFLICGPLERANREIGSVTVVDIWGPLEHHAGSGFDSYDAIKERARLALAGGSSAVILNFDSPGGLVSGVYETSRELAAMAAAAGKTLVSYASGECSSAAYALACAGSKILVPVGATMGSIGVIALAVDTTAADRAMGVRFEAISSGRRKTDGNPHVAITDESRAAMQATVDAQAGVFFDLVAQSRGMSADAVRGFQAGIFVGRQAVEVGLADDLAANLNDLAAQVSAGFSTESSAVASTASEGGIMGMKEIRKALGEAAAGDGDEAKKCRAALAALDGGDDEKKKDDAKAEGGDEPDGDEKKKDDEAKAKAEEETAAKAKAEDEAAKAKAATDDEGKAKASSNVIALASRVQTLEAERAAEREASERASLFASRPDLLPEVRKVFEAMPIEQVRHAMKNLPKGPLTAASLAAGAQPEVRPTVGQGQTYAQAVPLNEAQRMAIAMGTAKPDVTNAVTFDGVTQSVSALTREEARAYLEARAKASGAK
jgi:signal peptide peptidase SppA